MKIKFIWHILFICSVEFLQYTKTQKLLHNVRTHDSIQQQERQIENAQFPVYDFIIVGGGSAGCVLANRLSENPSWTILLLEAGKMEDLRHKIPVLAPSLQGSDSDWNDKTIPQQHVCLGMNNSQCLLPRGKVLGGSSSINLMMYSRGNRRDFDRWAEAGNTGWSYMEVLPYFLKSEGANLAGLEKSPYHNVTGPLGVSDIPYRTTISHAFIEAAQQAGHQITDYNGAAQLGVSYLQATERNGLRSSTYTAFIEPIQATRKNLHIITAAQVTRILIDPVTRTAYGVQYLYGNLLCTRKARKEVILSAGVFNSPQLLMLSGVGPAEHLNAIGVPIIQALPVGEKLYDHVAHMGPTFVTQTTGQLLPSSLVTMNNLQQFIKGDRSSFLSSPAGVEAVLFAKQPQSEQPVDVPDFEIVTTVGSEIVDAMSPPTSIFKNITYDTLNSPIKEANQDYFTLMAALFYPKSVGCLWLQDKDPLSRPVIDPNYLSNHDDVEVLLNGIKEAIRLVEMPAMQKIGARILNTPVPGCEHYSFGADDYWRCSIHMLGSPLSHAVGTCPMGPTADPTAVVSPQLKVYGIRKLRVADTSIMPTHISGHPNAAAIMIGEKAADMILDEWKN